MSSIFSLEPANDVENAALRPADRLLGSAGLEIASAAYGLNLNDRAVGAAIAPSPDALILDKAINDTYGEYPNASDNLLSEFVTSSISSTIHSSTAANSDELTGISADDERLPHTAEATTASSSLTGRLSFSDDLNPTRRYTFKDDYLFSTQRTETVRLNLNSSTFDTYLQLVEASTGRLLAFNDDGGQGSNSQLSFTARAGQQYTIRATSYESYETGRYSLTANIVPRSQPNPPNTRPNNFSRVYGYGLVDAASAVAAAIGQSRFNNVANIGGVQWNNDMINAPEVWNRGYTGRGVTVAVIDSGVDIFHEDLRNNIWENTGEVFGDGIDNDGNGYIDDRFGWNFGRGQNNYDVLPGTNDVGQGHGTHVAGTIAAARNGRGMTGVAYNSNIMAIRMGNIRTNAQGQGQFVNGGDLATAIRYAVDNGADVINMSLGWGDPTGSVRAALAYASERNVIAVMASGNQGFSAPSSPANNAIDYGISVGAVAQNGTIPSFSNQAGSNSRMRHVMAPGVEIYSTIPNGRWNFKGGTSMAAPHVAGVIALMLSANPNLTHAQVREILIGTATVGATTTRRSTSAIQSGRIANAAWQGNGTLQGINRWQGFEIDSHDSSLVALPALSRYQIEAPQDEDTVLVSESSQIANKASEYISEFSLRDSLMPGAAHTDDWRFQLAHLLVEDEWLVGAIA